MKQATNPEESSRQQEILAYRREQFNAQSDWVACEEPLEIRVGTFEESLWTAHSIAITMRTPGEDFALALGFLYTEGVISGMAQVQEVIRPLDDQGVETCNLVQVNLKPGTPFDSQQFSRHVFTSSSCGICGKMTIERIRATTLENPLCSKEMTTATLLSLPDQLLQAQKVFANTGGLHASALFDLDGHIHSVYEDVGRHNALDKLIGNLLQTGELPAKDRILLVSGRSSFELVQKAIIAGMPIMAAVGAPSSLAVSLAEEFGMTLVGFLKDDRFNTYSGRDRIQTKPAVHSKASRP